LKNTLTKATEITFVGFTQQLLELKTDCIWLVLRTRVFWSRLWENCYIWY